MEEMMEEKMKAMEARFEAKLEAAVRGLKPGAVEMEEVRTQLVGIAERVLNVVKLVGRKRKSDEGTLWGEVERTKKRMDGFEELRTRMEGLE